MPPISQVKIEIIVETKKGKKEIDEVVKTSLGGLGLKVKEVSATFEKASKDMGHNLTFIAWHFRYLGSIFDRIGNQMVKVIKDAITITAELEESFLSIRTAAAAFGKDAEGATELAKELAMTGLLPLVEAAGITKDLMIGGLGVPEMKQFIYRFLDVAFLWTSSADGMTKALEAMADAVLRGQKKIGMNTTATNLWLETNKRLEKTLGITLTELDKRGKLLAILQTIEEKYAYTLGFHRMEMETTRAKMVKLNSAIMLMKQSLGVALLPLVDALTQAMGKLSIYTQKLIDVFGPAIPIIVTAGVATAFFISKISWGIGILLSFSKIAYGTSLALWQVYLPVIAVSAVVMAGTYLFLRYSGALNNVKNSASAIDAQLKGLEDTYKGLMNVTEDSMDIDEEKAIAHRRTVEDIEEDLARERSKGLWANQMTIKDLEKRWKREDEDWNRYLESKGEAGEESNEGLLGNLKDTFGKIEEETKKQMEKITGLWDKLKDPQTWEGVRIAIQDFIGGSITDPAFWAEFGKNFLENLEKTIISIGDVISAAFEGLFESSLKGAAVVAASAFVIAFGSSILKLLPFKIAEIGIAAKLAFAAALPSTITITIILATAAAIYEALKLREIIQGLWSSAESGALLASKYIGLYGEMLREKKIDLETYKKLTDEVLRNQQEVIKAAERGGFWSGMVGQIKEAWKAPFWSLPGRQFGGIIPGPRNQPVPILAHGGERVIPAGEVGGGGNITINFNNAIVRESADLDRIAQKVGALLGQKARWARLGAY